MSVSRQREWQVSRVKAGRCQYCGRGPLSSKVACKKCLVKRRPLWRKAKRRGVKVGRPRHADH